MPPPSRERSSWLTSRVALLLAIVLPAALMCALVAGLPREVFWITDGGNRCIQVQSFARAAPPEILYPARPLDPSLRFFPWGGHHFQALGGGRVVSYYLPWFALLSLPGWRLAGAAGLHLLPLAAAVATLCLFPLLLAEAGLARFRAPATLGLGLATPLVFYGVVFWEHSLAVLLALGAAVLLLRAGRLAGGGGAPLWPAAWAGVLLALSTVLREEGYVLVVALLAAFLWAWARRAPRAAAAAAVAAALSLLGLRALARAAPTLARRRALAALAAVLAALGLAVEVRGLQLLALKKTGTERVLAAVRAAPGRAVVTDAYWVTEELAALYGERLFLEVGSDAAFRDALDLLRRAGHAEVTVVLSRRYGTLSPAVIADLRRRALGGRLVSTPGLGFLEVAVVAVRTDRP